MYDAIDEGKSLDELSLEEYMEICPVCNWENDKTQNEDSTFAGGANKECLKQAIANYCRRMGI